MGFELDAFLGKTSELQKWKQRLPSAVVCELSGDLGMVPLTGKLRAELRASLGNEEATRLDATQKHPTYPSPSHIESTRRWAAQASAETCVAYISMGEFGNQSHERATVWAGGKEKLSAVGLRAALDYFRDRAGLNLGDQVIESALEKYRGEDAAEKWAAANAAS